MPGAQSTAPPSAEPTPLGSRQRARLLLCGVALVGMLGLYAGPLAEPVRELLAHRAALVLEADFNQSLEGWFGSRDWGRAWSRDPSGFVRVGQLALFRPSMQLRNYQFEFRGRVDRESLGWVFRACDLSNYYAARLRVLKAAGPRPLIALERYAVVAGEVSQRVQVPIRENIDPSQPLRIAVEVEGDAFRTWVEGVAVDFWRDGMFPSGGVGFLGSAEDRGQVYWMRVRYHDDMLGKLCSLLAVVLPSRDRQGAVSFRFANLHTRG